MGGRTASVAVARVQSVRVSRGAGSPSALARFNPSRADHRRLAAVDGNPFLKAPLARFCGPKRALPSTADGPGSGSASPGQFGCRRTTSTAMKVRHGQQQQDAHRCDAPGRDPGRHGAWFPGLRSSTSRRANRRQLRGNIYLAKVTRVEPSLQAAFIEYGGNRHGFLAFSEIHPDYYQIPLADRQALLEDEARDAEEHREREERKPRRRSRGRRAEAASAKTSDTVSVEDVSEAVAARSSDDATPQDHTPQDNESGEHPIVPEALGTPDSVVSSENAVDESVKDEATSADPFAPDATFIEPGSDASSDLPPASLEGEAAAPVEAPALNLERTAPSEDAVEEPSPEAHPDASVAERRDR